MSAIRTCTNCKAELINDGPCARCLLSLELPKLPLGDHLLLGEELGQGGMGTVFRAEDTRLHRTVAVKLLRPEFVNDKTMRARLEREAQALAQLSHPNIVQVFEVGADDEQSYLVMEFVEGVTLAEMGRIAPARAAAIGAELCDGLAAAHARSIVHRDVKPANVMIDKSGRARLADFGIARSTMPGAGLRQLTAPGLQGGTPEYQAPELLEGAPAEPRTDLYAVGVLLYQAVTGQLPRGEFERLQEPLDSIVRRALARDPQRRYQAAVELRDDLRRAAQAAARDTSELPDEEQFQLWGAALACAAAAAISLWAALQSLTPRVVGKGELSPLESVAMEPLADGRSISWARFETGPILSAAFALSLTFAALAILRRHWRNSGLDVPRPLQPVASVRSLRALGFVICATYFLRKLAQAHGLIGVAVYAPFLGGLLEMLALYLFFVSMLHAWRTARPLGREPWLFLGFGLALVPPVFEFASYLVHWRP